MLQTNLGAALNRRARHAHGVADRLLDCPQAVRVGRLGNSSDRLLSRAGAVRDRGRVQPAVRGVKDDDESVCGQK